MPQIAGQGAGEPGVVGVSEKEDGVLGVANVDFKAGVAGVNEHGGNGVLGRGFNGTFGHGIGGGAGAVGTSDSGDGVLGIAKVDFKAGVAGVNDDGGNGMLARGATGIFAESNREGGRAAFFKGDVEVTGDIRFANADGAELFDTVSEIEIAPGSVVVVDGCGAIQPTADEYDRRVVGIVSGAGAYRPGLLLDHRSDNEARRPVAVFGKVYCQVDATTQPISAGDLLCSSRTPGHAMRAIDSARTPGAVIGKALAPLTDGTGLIPVLVTLQ